MSATAGDRGRGGFLPTLAKPDWLRPEAADALLRYAIEQEKCYVPAAVLHEGAVRVDANLRSALKLPGLGPFEALLKSRALDIKSELQQAFGMNPFEATQVEIEMVSHGDGAHFRRHVDTFLGTVRQRRPRILTLVLYLNRRPAGFTGGALRMYAVGTPQTRDILPDHNLMVAFPSIAPHSVEPILCRDGAFADRRFAVNMWIHG
ncbi:MAG: 2OG-Fe(II) oxygenase [Rhizomicrobium sp.]